MKKIKVVWICWFVNRKVHGTIDKRIPLWRRILGRKKTSLMVDEIARWNTNAISEFEKYDDVELHVICPYSNMKNSMEEFEKDNIHYHIFSNQMDSFITLLLIKCYRKFFCNEPAFSCNRKIIRQLIKDIKPDVIHVMGAENAFYSKAFLDIPDEIPSIIQLQTLLSDPEISKSYPSLRYRIPSEIAILKKAIYIGTSVERYRQIIKDIINESATFLNISLALTEKPNMEAREIIYDFVYFAANINKAVDLVIEAFAIAHKKRPNITLDIIGGYDDVFKAVIDKRIVDLGITGNVRFEGRIPAYEDVINQVRKARFALLPLKTDIVSSTIREAMANGLPTVTTITSGTPSLNKTMECVLLSDIGDHQAMANNMLRLLDDSTLAQKLSFNSISLTSERKSNSDITKEWIKAYRVISIK